jgi:hypothetical protein
MQPRDASRLWSAQQPMAWPAAPEYFTFSALREIEACPRRWALQSAGYPDVWDGRGYPPRLNVGRMAGTVVHDVIETLVRSFVRARCSSDSATAIDVMRKLGGFTMLVDQSIDRTLEAYRANPRGVGRVDSMRRTLRGQVGDLRRRAQTLLVGVQAPNGSEDRPTGSVRQTEGPRVREALAAGVHAEVTVVAQALRWRGKVDLLTLEQDGCEIVDFKTGLPAEHHMFQVLVYALLWFLDEDLNPRRLRATRLGLRYADGGRAVPAPSNDDLENLKASISERSQIARDQITMTVPPARPSKETCPNCDVRHLCKEYWGGAIREVNTPLSMPYATIDVECLLEARLGSANWAVRVRASSQTLPVDNVILRCAEPKVALRRGDIVRVLDGGIWNSREEPQTILNVGPSSELFVVPS